MRIKLVLLIIFTFSICGYAGAQATGKSKPGNSIVTEEIEAESRLTPSQTGLFNSVKAAVLAGKLKAYDSSSGSRQYTTEEVKMILDWKDTLFTENIATGQMDMQVIDQTITGKDIIMVKAKEQWVWNEKDLALEKKVKGLTFFINERYETGEIKGPKVLFYVSLAEAGEIQK